MTSSWHPFCPCPPLCPRPTQALPVYCPPLLQGCLYSKLSCYLKTEVYLFSFPHCQVASQATFSPSQPAFQGLQVLPVLGREGRRGKVDMQQLSGQSGPVGDGLWVSSPVWVGLLKTLLKGSVFFSALQPFQILQMLLPPRCSSRSIPPKHPEISAGCSR